MRSEFPRAVGSGRLGRCTAGCESEPAARVVGDRAKACNRSSGRIRDSRVGRSEASTPEFVLLGRDSLDWDAGELLFKREPDAVLFCTFVPTRNLVARAMWAPAPSSRRHLRIVGDLH